MSKGIVIGFFCYGLFLMHIFIFHYFNIKRHFSFMVKLFFCVLPIYIILFALVSEGQIEKIISILMPFWIFAFLNGIILHFSFCYLYLYFIQVIDRSPSTRIMVEIENSGQKRLTLPQLKLLYSIDEKISQEMADMLVLGYVRKDTDLYTLTNKGKRYMKIFKFTRDYLKLARN